MALEMIISGGQTGVDRAALDAALDNQFRCGGYCPKGRKAEDGVIDKKYPLTELSSDNYIHRTLENVLSSDCTLIIYNDELEGGTALTKKFCFENNKPFCEISAHKYNSVAASKLAYKFISEHNAKNLNIAGPRSSKWSDGYQYTYECVDLIVKTVLRE